MTTEPVRPSPEKLDLIDRFTPLHAHAALLRDVCAMLALDVTPATLEEMTQNGWYGLYLLSQTVTDEIEQLDDALTNMVMGNKL